MTHGQITLVIIFGFIILLVCVGGILANWEKDKNKNGK